jgi:16S rRNA (uracil1498-N3)-methyltransferase
VTDADWRGRHRLFVAPAQIVGSLVNFDKAQSRQLVRVLRISASEPMIVLDESGSEFLVRVTDPHSSSAVGEIVERRLCQGEPSLAVTLYQALLPRDRFEAALAKAVECGITRFVPLRTDRTIAKIDIKDWESRSERLRSIAREAAEQSERGRIPTIEPVTRLKDLLHSPDLAASTLLAFERGETATLQQAIRGASESSDGRVGLIIGPEGGFSEDEITAAKAANVRLICLGPRILRSETAGPVLTALILYEADAGA